MSVESLALDCSNKMRRAGMARRIYLIVRYGCCYILSATPIKYVRGIVVP